VELFSRPREEKARVPRRVSHDNFACARVSELR
jgi:hypothetical protein